MVSFYNVIDIVILIALYYLVNKAYQSKIYIKIFEYFKLFIIISISVKLSKLTAFTLESFYITKVDTYTTLIFIAFILNFLILFFASKYIIKLSNKYISSGKIKIFFAKVFTFLEVLILFTFTLYIIMQLYISKVYLYKYTNKTIIYPKIQKFYNKFLSDDFMNLILNSHTGTNYKEVIFKSFKNTF